MDGQKEKKQESQPEGRKDKQKKEWIEGGKNGWKEGQKRTLKGKQREGEMDGNKTDGTEGWKHGQKEEGRRGEQNEEQKDGKEDGRVEGRTCADKGRRKNRWKDRWRNKRRKDKNGCKDRWKMGEEQKVGWRGRRRKKNWKEQTARRGKAHPVPCRSSPALLWGQQVWGSCLMWCPGRGLCYRGHRLNPICKCSLSELCYKAPVLMGRLCTVLEHWLCHRMVRAEPQPLLSVPQALLSPSKARASALLPAQPQGVGEQ